MLFDINVFLEKDSSGNFASLNRAWWLHRTDDQMRAFLSPSKKAKLIECGYTEATLKVLVSNKESEIKRRSTQKNRDIKRGKIASITSDINFLLEKDSDNNFVALSDDWWKLRTEKELREIYLGKSVKDRLLSGGYTAEDVRLLINKKDRECGRRKDRIRMEKKKDKEREVKMAKFNFDIYFEKDTSGKFVALNPEWWKQRTTEEMEINFKSSLKIKKLIRGGYSKNDIVILMNNRKKEYACRYRKTTSAKEKRRKYYKLPHVQKRIKYYKKGLKSKQRRREWQKLPHVKQRAKLRRQERKRTEPLFKLAEHMQSMPRRVGKELNKNLSQEQILYLNERYGDRLGCSVDYFRDHLQSMIPEGMSFSDWRGYDPEKPTLAMDHILPVAFCRANAHKCPELLFYVNNYRNLVLIDHNLNNSKKSKVILELIPEWVPGYPFTNFKGRIYKTLESAGLDRAGFESYLKIMKGLTKP